MTAEKELSFTRPVRMRTADTLRESMNASPYAQDRAVYEELIALLSQETIDVVEVSAHCTRRAQEREALIQKYATQHYGFATLVRYLQNKSIYDGLRLYLLDLMPGKDAK